MKYISIDQREKLFLLLINLGFKRTDVDLMIMFILDRIIISFPITELKEYHLIKVRNQLSENDLMSDEEYNKIMNYE